MKKIIILSAVVAAVFAFSSCNMMAGSGVIEDYEFSVADFNSVTVSSTCNLTVIQGSDYGIVITCDDNLEPYLDVKKNGNVLNIGLAPFTSYNHITFKATVTMPELKAVDASEVSSVNVSGFDLSDDLSVMVNGASRVYVEILSPVNLNATVAEASELEVKTDDTAGTVNLICTEASKAQLTDGSVAAAVVDISSASSVGIRTNGPISGNVSGASKLLYWGNADTSSLNVDFASVLQHN